MYLSNGSHNTNGCVGSFKPRIQSNVRTSFDLEDFPSENQKFSEEIDGPSVLLLLAPDLQGGK